MQNFALKTKSKIENYRLIEKGKADLFSLDTLTQFSNNDISRKAPSAEFLFHCEIIKNLLDGKPPPTSVYSKGNSIFPFDGYGAVPTESTVVIINNFAMEAKNSRAEVRAFNLFH